MSNIDNFTNNLRLGVIGTGKISQIILPMLKEFDVSVTSLTDLNLQAAEALAEEIGGATVYPSLDKLLSDGNVEAVYIATPPSLHGEHTRQALAAGKHVICEKPFTLNAAEARELAQAASAYPDLLVGCCCSRFHYSPMAEAAAEVVNSGTLGRIRQVRMMSSCNVPVPLDQLPPWKRQAASAGGGLIADWGIYDISWLQYVLGEKFAPLGVQASFNDWNREGTDMDSGYDLYIRCASGLDVFVTRQPEIGPKKNQVEIRGEAGGLNLPFAPDEEKYGAQLYTLKEGSGTPEMQVMSKGTSSWNQLLCGPIVNMGQAIHRKAAVSAPPESQVLVHKLLDAILESGRSHRTVTLPG